MGDQARARIEWIDSLKGIGIIFVVAGHTFQSTTVQALVYMFHMPLFFALSGYLFRPNPDLRQYASKGLRHLLIPYACFLVILLVPTLLASNAPITPRALAGLAARFMYGGAMLKGFEGPFWFITCFFFTQQLCNLMVVKCKTRTADVIMIASLIAGYANQYAVPGIQFPLAINVCLVAMPFFYLAYRARSLEESGTSIALSVAICAGSIAVVLHFPIAYDMKYTNYGIPVISFIVAYAWFIALRALARATTSVPSVSQALSSLGAMSMGIMFTHQLIQISLRDHDILNNDLGRFAISLCASYAVSRVIASSPQLARLLLGIQSVARDRILPARESA